MKEKNTIKIKRYKSPCGVFICNPNIGLLLEVYASYLTIKTQ